MNGVDSAADERRQFEVLCQPLRADVLRFLFWLCRDRALAEDILQETLLRAWRSMASLKDRGAVKPWLLTIARRELARVFERKRLDGVDIDTLDEDELAATQSLEVDQEVNDMRRAILRLDSTYREPLVLQILFGYSTEEIANQMQLTVSAALTRLYRARQKLRQEMLGDTAPEELSP